MTKIFILFCMLDLITTYIGGIQNEANPVGQIIASRYGIWGLAAVKVWMVGQYAGTIVVFRWMKCPLEKYFQRAVIGAYILLIAWNIFCISWNLNW